MEGGFGALVSAVKKQIDFFSDFVVHGIFPDYCGGCQKEGVIACDGCWSRIPLFFDAAQSPVPIHAVTDFHAPVVRAVVHAFKYDRRKEAAALISEALGRWPKSQTLQAAHWQLVPIPMHPRRERERGGNHARRLAELLADAGWGSVHDALVRVRFTKSQTTLGRQERAVNVANAFVTRQALDPTQPYLLVDDVATTGATLASAADALRGAGVTNVAAWVFARD